MENQLDNIFRISFDETVRAHLKTIAMWAKVASICAFARYAIAIAIAFVGKPGFSSAFNVDSFQTNVFFKGTSVAGALLAAIFGCAINYFLYKFAIDAKAGVSNINQQKLNEGLRNLKTYYKISGIILIVVISILVLIVFFAMLAFLLQKH